MKQRFSHVNKALELTPNSATALAAKGLILAEKAGYLKHAGQSDPAVYQQAQNLFQRSLELEENATTHQWYSELLAKVGRHAEALEHLHKAIALNPLSASLQRSFSFTLQYLGKTDSAQKVYQTSPGTRARFGDSIYRRFQTQQIYAQTLLQKCRYGTRRTPPCSHECPSIRYCEQMAFMYLSIGANDMANEIMANLGP